MRPSMLAGMTLPLEYQSALQNWRAEKNQRQRELNNNPNDESLPLPRGFFSYAQDPNADGNNDDSLFNEEWWGNALPGRNQAMLDMYTMSLKNEAPALRDGVLDWAAGKVNYGIEVISPGALVKTSMADYVPNPINIFTEIDGSRLDAAGEPNFWKRTGITFGTGAVGYGTMALMGLGLIMVAPKLTERTLEIAEQATVGVLEIAEKVVTKGFDIATLRQVRTNKKALKEAMGD
jgi:hypothetical protein